MIDDGNIPPNFILAIMVSVALVVVVAYCLNANANSVVFNKTVVIDEKLCSDKFMDYTISKILTKDGTIYNVPDDMCRKSYLLNETYNISYRRIHQFTSLGDIFDYNCVVGNYSCGGFRD